MIVKERKEQKKKKKSAFEISEQSTNAPLVFNLNFFPFFFGSFPSLRRQQYVIFSSAAAFE